MRKRTIAAMLSFVLLLTLLPTQTWGQSGMPAGETAKAETTDPTDPAAPGGTTTSDPSGDSQTGTSGEPSGPTDPVDPEDPNGPTTSTEPTGPTGSTTPTDPTDPTEPQQKIIAGFTPLSEKAVQINMIWGSPNSPTFPKTLKAVDAAGNQITVTDLTWKSDRPFNKKKRATYTFTPQLPQEYQLAEGVRLPTVKVSIKRKFTEVTGIGYSRSGTAGKTMTDSIAVEPAYGRTIKLQRYNSSTKQWATKASFKTENLKRDVIKLRFPKAWYETGSSKWRVSMSATDWGTTYNSKSIAVKAKRVYNNPSKYLQLQEKITVSASGGYTLRRGTMGLKVARVQRKLGMGHRWEIMDSATISKVKSFQRKKGLKATGIVNLKTWKAMGFSESSWYQLGKYIPEVKTDLTSTRSECIEVMIKTAKSYLGDEYIVGAAGKPGQGADCSGLVMQSLYAAGLNPLPVSVVRHSQPGYEYESRNLWTHKKMKHVSYSNRKRGDLIFYRGRSGAIIHVAIYLGDNKVIESWPEKVCIWPIKNSHRSYIAGVVRPFV